MRKRWRFGLAAFGVAVLAVGGWLWLRSRDASRVDPVWNRIQASGVLRVGMEASYPPFEFMDADGNIRGLDVDLAEALAACMGARLEIVNIGFDGLYQSLQDGQFDLIVSALPYDPFLIKDFNFSHAYFNAGLRWVARPEVLPELVRPDASRVGVQLGSSAEVEARTLQRRFPGMSILTYEDEEQVKQALLAGETDGALMDGVAALQFLAAQPEFQMGEDLLTDEPYVIGIPIKASRLKKEVNAALVAFRDSGQLESWAERWLR